MAPRVTANRLGDGRVVFLADGYRWVEEIGLARVGETDEAAKALLAIAEKAAAGHRRGALSDRRQRRGDHADATARSRALGPSSHRVPPPPHCAATAHR
jgi:hypothetical protein